MSISHCWRINVRQKALWRPRSAFPQPVRLRALRKDFNTSIANEVTAFGTGLTPREVAIGYKLAEALSKPNLDLAATNEKLKKHRDARRDVDDDSADGAMAA
jgi:hypothetical protein